MNKRPHCGTRAIDKDRTDNAVLALLVLGIHDGFGRTWNAFDSSAIDRLHVKGLISDPRSEAKSMLLTEEGFTRAQALFEAMFTKEDTE